MRKIAAYYTFHPIVCIAPLAFSCYIRLLIWFLACPLRTDDIPSSYGGGNVYPIDVPLLMIPKTVAFRDAMAAEPQRNVSMYLDDEDEDRK